jgi:hypothetical protein
MAKVLTGGRAELSIDGVVVGIFESCTYGANVGVEPIFILGSFGPKEITPTSYEAISVNCSGFRVVNSGAHVLPKFPKLQDLLNLGAITISIRDRQAGANSDPIMVVTGCVPVSYNTGVNAKATSRLQVSYIGLKLADESGDQSEQNPTDLP